MYKISKNEVMEFLKKFLDETRDMSQEKTRVYLKEQEEEREMKKIPWYKTFWQTIKKIVKQETEEWRNMSVQEKTNDKVLLIIIGILLITYIIFCLVTGRT